MGSWVGSLRKLSKQAKLSLLVGEPTPVTYLEQQITALFDRTLFLDPPLTPDGLSTVIGTPDESQATVVSSVDVLGEDGWDLLASYLAPAKVPGTTLVLVGESLPDYPAAQRVKELAGRGKNVYAQATSPSGAAGRDELIGWVAETWSIYPHDADYACARADFDLTSIVWATKVFLALTGGKPVIGETARKLIDIAVPASPLADAYTAIIRRSREAPRSVHGFTPEQTLSLLKWLESTLFELDAIRPAVQQREPLGKVSKVSGVHISKVKELKPLLSLYSADTEARCREVLDLGFSSWMQPGCAETVALLWA